MIKSSKTNILVIGSFDGVHYAHRKIIFKALQLAKKTKEDLVVYTFYKPPRLILNKFKGEFILTTANEKRFLLKKIGVKNIFFQRFTKRFSNNSPIKFLEIIYKKFNPSKILVGYNFRFGKDAKGDIKLLKRFCKQKGIEVLVSPEIKYKNSSVSSGIIRKLLINGDYKKAKKLLSYDYTIIGKKIKGRNIGSQLGYPTINIKPFKQKILPDGVYIVKVEILSKKPGLPYYGVCNIGRRPTFGYNKKTVEFHIVSKFYNNKKDKIFVLYLLEKIREEKKIQINKSTKKKD